MDLSQRKLTRNEWEAIETPVSVGEKEILNLIYNGFDDVEYKYNVSKSLLGYIKLSNTSEEFHRYLYNEYFKNIVDKLCKQYGIKLSNANEKQKNKKIKIKKADTIRINSFDKKIKKEKENIYEFIMLDIAKKLLKKSSIKYYYTLVHLMKNNVSNVNIYAVTFLKHIIKKFEILDKSNIIFKATSYIEENEVLGKYRNFELYEHQKQIFSIFSQEKNIKNEKEKEKPKAKAKIVLYQAPTGTGKTLTPIGLCKGYKVIFVCAAKHIGLQLAKSCISKEIAIAVAFGCETASDIRLHYYAAKEYTKHRKTGGIFRVDNEVGDKVELIISDIQSYMCAMNYMMAFNEKENIILYWDEPTITLDYDNHPFHELLKNNWKENMIPNIVLSSATLPNKNEIEPMINTFKTKFPDSECYEIISYDTKKSIPLIDSNGYVCLPHYLYENYDTMKNCISYLSFNLTILRYLDLSEISACIKYIHEKFVDISVLNDYFKTVDDITMSNIKMYYLKLLSEISEKDYQRLYKHFIKSKQKKYESTIKLTTEDAKTLTDGPTIFLVENVDKIALHYLKASNIKKQELDTIMVAINKNVKIKNEIEKLDKEVQEYNDKLGSVQLDKQHNQNSDVYKFREETKRKYAELNKKLQRVELDNSFIPNKLDHYNRYHSDGNYNNRLFTSDISEEIVEEIMLLDIKAGWKILLMLGIGIFKKNNNTTYNEIMKKLAYQQKLYLIVASSDYIYGTNYQFCHGYMGKDLQKMTQEKIIQAFGRVGRQKQHQNYSIRLRDNGIINKLFFKEENKIEVRNMNKLFV